METSPPKLNYYVSIAGIMGSGKTTVANLLAKGFKFHLFEENVEENRFLPLFYQESARWALHAQLFYLREKTAQLARIKSLLDETSVVQDSPIYQDYYTYAKAQHLLGYINADEFNLYEKFFHTLHKDLPVPHLIIQLEASPEVIKKRVEARERDYEKGVDIAYLELLSRLQREWIMQSPHLAIVTYQTDERDLAHNPQHQHEFMEFVRRHIPGVPDSWQQGLIAAEA